MSYDELLIADLRLTILEILQAAPEYAINDYVLDSALAQLRLGVTTDQLHTELAWLAEQGLVKLEYVSVPGMTVQTVQLTRRGEDAALGRARIPGIARRRTKS